MSLVLIPLLVKNDLSILYIPSSRNFILYQVPEARTDWVLLPFLFKEVKIGPIALSVKSKLTKRSTFPFVTRYGNNLSLNLF